MRVLFSSTSGAGHVQPVLPLAIAMRERGHEVRWATGEDGCGWVRAAGIDAVANGMSSRERMAEYERRWPAYAALRGEARAEKMFPRLFGAVSAEEAFPGLLRLAREWQPDVIVSEAADFAAPVVAAALGVPHANHGFGLVVPRHRVELAGELAAPLWQQVGLEPRPLGGVYDHVFIDIYPPSMQPDDLSYITRIVRRRPGSMTDGDFAMDDDVVRLLTSDRPLVYVTFGTVFNDTPTFPAVVDALRRVGDVDAVVTVGPNGDPTAFGPMPGHIVIARYVSQREVFPRTSLVASHAGSGTLLGALAMAIPQVCLPQAADQFRNSDAVVTAGAGVQLKGDDATAAAIERAIGSVLATTSYREAAATIASEIAAMPSVDDVAEIIERL